MSSREGSRISLPAPGSIHPGAAVPALDFRIEAAGFEEFAVAPTLWFRVHVGSTRASSIRSIQLEARIRIAATEREYDRATRLRLADLFGEPHRWGTTLGSLFWTRASSNVTIVPGGEIVCDLAVHCTYDFEVAAAKYFHGLQDGEVPLEFLFSGTLLYLTEAGALQIARFTAERESRFRLPVRIWKEMMQRHFPNSAWLRLHLDTFSRLDSFRTKHAIPTWEAVLELLLNQAENRPSHVITDG